MKTYSHMLSEDMDALGIYVEFEDGVENVFRYKLSHDQPYRYRLKISLPLNLHDKWVPGVTKVIRQVQAGQSWPIRLSAENATRYFSVVQLEQVERSLRGVKLYMYGVAEQSAFNEDDLRKWSNAALRERYARIPTLTADTG